MVVALVAGCAPASQVPTSAFGPQGDREQDDEDAASAIVIPVPLVSLSRTRGRTVGGSPVVLLRDDDAEVDTIFAPELSYNEFTGVNGGFRLYRLADEGTRARVITSVSQRNDFRIASEYEDPAFFHRRIWFFASAEFRERGTRRFFGVGPDADVDDETAFSHRRGEVSAWGGYQLSSASQLRLRLRFTDTGVGPSIVPGVADTLEEFPDVAGIDGHRTFAPSVSFRYDARDDDRRSTSGVLALVGVELSHRSLGSSAGFAGLEADLRGYVPLVGDRLIAAARVRVEHAEPFGGDRVPFLELPRLGGPDTLRGLSRDRLADAASLLASYEARVRLLTTEFLTTVDWELAPFVDAGAVAPSLTALRRDDVSVSAGLGARAVVRAGGTGRVDLAISEEKVAIIVALQYPF